MSVRFLDGPAAGAALSLRRAPIFLRVVIDRRTKAVDALDQLSDTPEPTEAIYVYRRSAYVGSAIVCSRGRGGGCRSEQVAEYSLHPEQPEDAVMRDEKRWGEWAEQQWKKEHPDASS